MTARRLIFLSAVTFFVTTGSATAGTLNIGAWSQQSGPEHATAGGSVTASAPTGGSAGTGAASGTPVSDRSGGGAVSPYPTLSSNSPLLKDPGHGSFWYSDGSGQQCLYTPNVTETTPCFNVVTPGTPAKPAARAVNPATLAAKAAKSLSLDAGQITASPSARVDGLTGSESWFWLTPTPGTESAAASAGGERVTVTAKESSVDWSFGDNTTLDGGPGVPYDPDATPAGAVTHDYATRCLPGDQGHDPYVLASCGPNGYTITATVAWTITYTATGVIARSGALTSRTTSASMTYPVTEARGFLTSAGDA